METFNPSDTSEPVKVNEAIQEPALRNVTNQKSRVTKLQPPVQSTEEESHHEMCNVASNGQKESFVEGYFCTSRLWDLSHHWELLFSLVCTEWGQEGFEWLGPPSRVLTHWVASRCPQETSQVVTRLLEIQDYNHVSFLKFWTWNAHIMTNKVSGGRRWSEGSRALERTPGVGRQAWAFEKCLQRRSNALEKLLQLNHTRRILRAKKELNIRVLKLKWQDFQPEHLIYPEDCAGCLTQALMRKPGVTKLPPAEASRHSILNPSPPGTQTKFGSWMTTEFGYL